MLHNKTLRSVAVAAWSLRRGAQMPENEQWGPWSFVQLEAALQATLNVSDYRVTGIWGRWLIF